MFKNILVPLDGSTLAEAILPHAQAMAAAFGARVFLLHVLEAPPGGSLNLQDWHLRRAEAEAYLRKQDAFLRQAGVCVESQLLEGPAAERIVEYAGEQKINLIILSSHGRGGPSEWNVAHIAQKVLQRGTTSILLVRSDQSGSPFTSEGRYRRILVPLDGSRRAECVLPVARKLARQQAELLLAHVTASPFIFSRLPFTASEHAMVDWLIAHNQASAGKYLHRLARSMPSTAQTALPAGDNVALTLHQLVRDEAVDLVLLSAHGHSAQSQWPYGSLVGNFIAHGTAPLLIVQDLPQPLIRRRERQAARRQPLHGRYAGPGSASGYFPPHQEPQPETQTSGQ